MLLGARRVEKTTLSQIVAYPVIKNGGIGSIKEMGSAIELWRGKKNITRDSPPVMV
jgi:hypothetical protein